MKNYLIKLIFPLFLLLSQPAMAGWAPDLIKRAQDAAEKFKQKDKRTAKFFSSSVGYAVFPNVGKGGLGLGGMNGDGVLFEGGKPVGYTELTAVTVGFQAGGQSFIEIIFFQNKKVMDNFKNGDLKFNAQVSAVAATAGASADANYKEGVLVFTMAKGGLMYEASVGGQGFSFEPIEKKK